MYLWWWLLGQTVNSSGSANGADFSHIWHCSPPWIVRKTKAPIGPPTRVGMWMLRAFSQHPLSRACRTPSIKKVKLKVNPGCLLDTMAKSSPMCKSAANTRALAPPNGCCSIRIRCIRLKDEDGILVVQLLGRLDGLPVNWNHRMHLGALTCCGCEWLTIMLLLITGSQYDRLL